MRNLTDPVRRRAARILGQQPVPVGIAGGVFSISFDDFPQSAWEVAGPILKDHGVLATYFVAGGLCDGENIGKRQFSVNDLQALFEAGHEVGCHTFDHVSALRIGPAALEAQIARNARWVSERLDGHTMTQFAWPFGDVSLSAKAVVARHFEHSRGVRDGVNSGRADRNNLQAIGLESRRLPHYDLEALMARTADSNGWLIAYGHDVEDNPTPYGCTPEDLVRIIEMARQAGLTIAPVSSAASMMASTRI
ncbi:polysaccharide deacetylase family protein [Brevundimonas sp.]|uniref:polysaccharide deacetylase family protein n=1 Tax=Brevundimonas sp. TaxID=1871086 RepID=UPI0028973D1F|nr:polysaccharide deacetylase family protein [Brevundimonas sp.]